VVVVEAGVPDDAMGEPDGLLDAGGQVGVLL
jgi:hypothetical protein